ncbi:uncharacterized protein A4U43_C09F4860 [Asparagus officinalis]|uniref:Uncharacterized protein n=1 Tax=Asparagus officinalis TaxID=4686 RepID=A0A5P1E5D3_ASPOF|nr:uncharacterized protein A4U43_C09F4860 [Asparagus officinalis]
MEVISLRQWHSHGQKIARLRHCQTVSITSVLLGFHAKVSNMRTRPPWFPREGEQHEDGDPGYHRGRNSDGEGGAHGEEAEDAAIEDGGVEGRPTDGEVGAGA